MVRIFPSFPTRSALFCMTLLTDARELLSMTDDGSLPIALCERDDEERVGAG